MQPLNAAVIIAGNSVLFVNLKMDPTSLEYHCLGGEHANQLQEEFWSMEREFSTPHASPLKHHSEGEGVSDPDSDVDSPDPSTNVHYGMFMLDMSPIDKREEMFFNFISMSCGCKLGSNNDASSNQFSKYHFSFYRNNCSEMSRHELDLIILTAISCSYSPPGDSSCSAKTKYTIIIPSCFCIPYHVYG